MESSEQDKTSNGTASERQTIAVEVAFALPARQVVVALRVRQGCTAREAVEQSGIARQFPDFDISNASLGIFSRPLNGIELPLPESCELTEGDRVEIYRPLKLDPKQARLERARKTQRGKQGGGKPG